MSEPQSISQKLISGSASAAIGKFVTAASALAINAILARVLEPEEMGAYFLVSSIVMIGALLSQLGVNQAIVRLIAASYQVKEVDTSRSSIKAAYLIVFTSVSLFTLVYINGFGVWIGTSVFQSSLVASVAVVTALWLILRSLQILISQMFRGFHQILHATVFEGALTSILVLFSLLVVWLVWGWCSLYDVILITSVSLLITIMAGIIFLRSFYEKTAPVNGCDIKGTLKISLPLFIASAAVPCISEAHIWILGMIASEDEVAIYGAAFRTARFVVVPLLVINSVIPPMIAQLMSKGETAKVEKILRATATVSGVPSIMIVIVLGLFSSDILTLMFGNYYASGGTILLVLISAQAINSLTGSPGVLLMMSNHQKIVMKFALLSGILGVVFSLVLVSSLGGVGVAIGVAVGLIMHNLLMWTYCKFKLGINTHMGISGFTDVISKVRNRVT